MEVGQMKKRSINGQIDTSMFTKPRKEKQSLQGKRLIDWSKKIATDSDRSELNNKRSSDHIADWLLESVIKSEEKRDFPPVPEFLKRAILEDEIDKEIAHKKLLKEFQGNDVYEHFDKHDKKTGI